MSLFQDRINALRGQNKALETFSGDIKMKYREHAKSVVAEVLKVLPDVTEDEYLVKTQKDYTQLGFELYQGVLAGKDIEELKAFIIEFVSLMKRGSNI